MTWNCTDPRCKQYSRAPPPRLKSWFTGVLLLFVLLHFWSENVALSSTLSTMLMLGVLRSDGSAVLAHANDTIPSSKERSVLPYGDNRTHTVASPTWNISIVVQLSGELGNHLSKIAFGYSVQQRLWDRYGVASHLILQHQERGSKWISARRDMQACFPHFRSTDFSLGNTPEFSQRMQQQQKWLGHINASKLVFVNLISSEDVDLGLLYLYELLLTMRQQNEKNISRTSTTFSVLPPEQGTITLPFIFAQSFASWEEIDTYYHQLQNLFRFDNEACCQTVPHADEHVFHFRNYLAEMPRRAKQKGFEEASPNQTVLELFSTNGGLTNEDEEYSHQLQEQQQPPPRRLVMTTRRYNDDARAYLDAFSHAGWSARIVENQTGIQDFCFLQRAQRALVGMARSTYVLWAGLLGNATVVVLYSINSTETRAAWGEEGASIHYRWQTAALKNRIKFVTLTPRKNETPLMEVESSTA